MIRGTCRACGKPFVGSHRCGETREEAALRAQLAETEAQLALTQTDLHRALGEPDQ